MPTSGSDSRLFRIARANPVDPLASVAASILLIASILGVPARLGVSENDMGAIVGAVLIAAASLRTFWEARRIK